LAADLDYIGRKLADKEAKPDDFYAFSPRDILDWPRLAIFATAGSMLTLRLVWPKNSRQEKVFHRAPSSAKS
jgi:hypothetical protein